MAFNNKLNSQARCGEILVSNNTDYTIVCVLCQKNFQSFDYFIEHRVSTCMSTMIEHAENTINVKIEDINDSNENGHSRDNFPNKFCEDYNYSRVSNVQALQENNQPNNQKHTVLDSKLDKINGSLDNINIEVSGLHIKYDRLIDILTKILPQTQPLIQNLSDNSNFPFSNDNEEEIDHLEKKVWIDNSISQEGEYNEETVNNIEIANNSEDLMMMPKKGSMKYSTNDWEIIGQFTTKLDAENYLKNDWAKHASYKSSKGIKEYYRCNKIKFRGPQCDAKLFITYDETSPDVILYSNNKDHTHRQLKNKTTSICPRMKSDILEMAVKNIKPRYILKRLYQKYSDEKLIVPSLSQISSFLKRRKRNDSGPRNYWNHTPKS